MKPLVGFEYIFSICKQFYRMLPHTSIGAYFASNMSRIKNSPCYFTMHRGYKENVSKVLWNDNVKLYM